MFFTKQQKDRFEVPTVIRKKGSRPGKTLLVTGAMDGDEYAGTAACLRAADLFPKEDFSGEIIFIPVVNVAGFFEGTSWNPLDHKHPKFVFPGRKNGTSTERLVHWLTTEHVSRADAWYDMHGAALTEGLRPFVWLYKTGERGVDVLSQTFARDVDASMVLFEDAGFVSKSKLLAKKGILYAIAESGSQKSDFEEDVARHLTWLSTMMATLGMIGSAPPEKRTKMLLRSWRSVCASRDGMWQLAERGALVRKGERLGTHISFDGRREDIVSPCDGVPLWWREVLATRKGEVLFALGLP